MSGNALTSLLKRSWAALDDPSRRALKRAVIYQLVFGLVLFVLYVVAVPWLEHADISLLVTALVALLVCCAVGLVLVMHAYRPIRDCYLARERAKRPDDDGIGWRGADGLILYWATSGSSGRRLGRTAHAVNLLWCAVLGAAGRWGVLS
ncbi:MAG TPA: hypothetical protein IAD14_07565 [Candidatus Coprousia avicola]|nr:hypothetical protein [Candidatus Coprousia avicola]